ncbi:MAG: alpha/beta hydrolase-fold protein [Myxococcota bacterium]
MSREAMREIVMLAQQLSASQSSAPELIESFVAEHRFPIVDDETAVFFLRDARADAAFLVHWVFGLEGRQPLIRLLDTDALYLPVKLPHEARIEYKFEIRDREGHSALVHDPLNPQRAHDPFGSNSVCAMPGYQVPRFVRPDPDTRPGRIVAFDHDSEVYGGSRRVQVYLPSEYKDYKRYPVVICHDGHDYLAYADTREVLDNLIARHEVAPIIVAFTSGLSRNEEYAASPKQADYVVQELLPALEQRFRISDRPEDRGLMGASFGAVTSLFTAWQYPGRFGRLLLQSGSFVHTDVGHHGRPEIFDPVVAFVGEFRADPGRIQVPRVFLSCGTFESLIWFNRSLVHLLRQAGIEARFVESQDGHNWVAWRDRLRDGLAWLFPGRLWTWYE